MKSYKERIQTKTSISPKIQLFLVVLVVVLAVVLIYGVFSPDLTTSNSSAEPQAASNIPAAPAIYMNPQSHTYAKGSTFTVEIRENSGGTPVNAVQVKLAYPVDRLTFVRANGSASAFPVQAQNNGADGQLELARGIIGSVSGDHLVAKVTFKAAGAAGQANISFTSGTALLSSSDNKDILTSGKTPGATYTIK